MLTGAWDFTCVLLGLSGFILIGGPILLSILDTEWRRYWFGGEFKRIREVWDANRAIWTAITAGYWLLLLGGTILFVRARRHVTAIYNLDPASLEETIIGVLESVGLGWQRVLGGFVIGQRKKQSPHSENASDGGRSKIVLAGETAFVQIDTFPALRHASLRWRDYDVRLRKQVETELDRALVAGESPENPASGWFMTAAVALFFVMLLWVGFILYQMFANPRAI